MNKIINKVSSHIYSFSPEDIEDFDEVVDQIRVYVEFDEMFNQITIKQDDRTKQLISEIFDAEWEQLYEDTAVFTSRLKRVVDDYNRAHQLACEQSRQIEREYKIYKYL